MGVTKNHAVGPTEGAPHFRNRGPRCRPLLSSALWGEWTVGHC